MSFPAMAWRYLRFRWLVSLLPVAGIAPGVESGRGAGRGLTGRGTGRFG